jgi:hypothetical protein
MNFSSKTLLKNLLAVYFIGYHLVFSSVNSLLLSADGLTPEEDRQANADDNTHKNAILEVFKSIVNKPAAQPVDLRWGSLGRGRFLKRKSNASNSYFQFAYDGFIESKDSLMSSNNDTVQEDDAGLVVDIRSMRDDEIAELRETLNVSRQEFKNESLRLNDLLEISNTKMKGFLLYSYFSSMTMNKTITNLGSKNFLFYRI